MDARSYRSECIKLVERDATLTVSIQVRATLHVLLLIFQLDIDHAHVENIEDGTIGVDRGIA